MLLSFPHMGKLHLALSSTCRLLDLPCLVPSPPGPLALSLGQELAPEGSCLPFCLVLGNIREALEAGADTIIMLGGCGPCRFGYFIYLAVRILNDAGYRFQPLIIDKGHHLSNYNLIKRAGRVSGAALLRAARMGWETVACEETIARVEREELPRAVEPGCLRQLLDECRQNLMEATTLEEVVRIRAFVLEAVHQTQFLPHSEVLKIGLVGDIYTLLEPYANHRIEEYLKGKGIVTYKEMAVSRWIPNTVLPWRRSRYYGGLLQEAAPYLRFCAGGFSLETVANARIMKRRQVDGIIQIFPLGCMPEIVARSVLNRVCRDEDIPVLSVTMDQHDSMTGFETRLEAFLDMIGSARRNRGCI